MTTPSTQRSTLLAFLGTLLAKTRGVIAVVALVVWLVASGAFALLEPDFDLKGDEPDFMSVDFWRNGWWRYSSTNGVSLEGLYFQDSAHGWVVGGSGTLLSTRDGGETWTRRNSGVTVSLNSIHFTDGNHGWAVGASGVILATENGGETWTRQHSNTDEQLSAVFFSDTTHGWVVIDAVSNDAEPRALLLSTSDGGRHWTGRKIADAEHLNSLYFADAEHGWAVGYGGIILATEDGGVTWSRQTSPTEKVLKSVAFPNPNDGWAVGFDGIILATQDGGKHWIRQDSGSTGILRSVRFVDDTRGWLVDSEVATLRATKDGGRTWTKVGESENWRYPPSQISFLDHESGWAIDIFGWISKTVDGGKHWSVRHFVQYNRLPFWYWLFSIGCGAYFLVGLVGLRAPSGTDAISALLSSDRPRRGSESDALGAKPLAWALSRFLRHRNTEPPLTIALNAPWGGGKSSLMNWLREDLERFGFRPAWFNAWHYEKQEQMFPALLETIRQQAVPPWLSWSGLWFRLRLVWYRAKERPAMATLLLILACFPAGYIAANPNTIWQGTKSQIAATVEQAFPKQPQATHPPEEITTNVSPQKPEKAAAKTVIDTSNPLAWMIGLFPGLAPLFGLWKGLQSFSTGGDWLGRWFNPTEQSKATRETAYRAQFARDFRAVSSALDNTLVIFIDDLDRCQPKSVCEVMETLNFLASEGSCHMILGIWREGVERAIGLGFADAAKEFAHIDELQTGSATLDEAEQRRRYGQLYLEKLVNIWVAVPSFDEAATRGMVGRLDRLTPESGGEVTSMRELSLGRKHQLLEMPLQWFRRNWQEWQARGRWLVSRDAWRNNRVWAAQMSRGWRLLIKPAIPLALGIVVLIGSKYCYYQFGWRVVQAFDLADRIFDESVVIFLLYVALLGLGVQWFWKSTRFLVLSRLPRKPPPSNWIGYGLLIFLVIWAGWSMLETGSHWSATPPAEVATAAESSTAPTAVASPAGPGKPVRSPTEISSSPAPRPSTGKAAAVLSDMDKDDLRLQIVFMMVVALLLWIEWLRFRLESPSDSPAFEEALQFWSPVLAKRFDTPRRYKRFLNHLRFNAMRLRTLDRPDRTTWEQAWNRYIRGEEPETAREDEMQGRESGLLLLSVLEACCGDDFLTKSMLVTRDGAPAKSFHPGWDGHLAIDAQLTSEQGTAWSADLRKLLVERLRLFEANAMPQPSLTDLKQFEALTPARITPKSVRTAGLSEHAASWDAKTERRHRQDRRGSTVDTSRFVADRRTGRDRRAPQAAPAASAV